MTVPYRRPLTADQARSNMLHWAEVAEDQAVAGAAISPGQAAIEKSKMWAAIAQTLPEAEATVVTADDVPIVSVRTAAFGPEIATEKPVMGSYPPGKATGVAALMRVLRTAVVEAIHDATSEGVPLIVSEQDMVDADQLVVDIYRHEGGAYRLKTRIDL